MCILIILILLFWGGLMNGGAIYLATHMAGLPFDAWQSYYSGVLVTVLQLVLLGLFHRTAKI